MEIVKFTLGFIKQGQLKAEEVCRVYQYVLVLMADLNLDSFPDQALLDQLKLSWKATVVEGGFNTVTKLH